MADPDDKDHLLLHGFDLSGCRIECISLESTSATAYVKTPWELPSQFITDILSKYATVVNARRLVYYNQPHVETGWRAFRLQNIRTGASIPTVLSLYGYNLRVRCKTAGQTGPRRCFHCQDPSHLIRDCPRRSNDFNRQATEDTTMETEPTSKTTDNSTPADNQPQSLPQPLPQQQTQPQTEQQLQEQPLSTQQSEDTMETNSDKVSDSAERVTEETTEKPSNDTEDPCQPDDDTSTAPQTDDTECMEDEDEEEEDPPLSNSNPTPWKQSRKPVQLTDSPHCPRLRRPRNQDNDSETELVSYVKNGKKFWRKKRRRQKPKPKPKPEPTVSSPDTHPPTTTTTPASTVTDPPTIQDPTDNDPSTEYHPSQ